MWDKFSVGKILYVSFQNKPFKYLIITYFKTFIYDEFSHFY